MGVVKRLVESDSDAPVSKRANTSKDTTSITPGSVITGRIDTSFGKQFARIRVTQHVFLRLRPTDIELPDDWKSGSIESLNHGLFVKCVALKPIHTRYVKDAEMVDCSLRPDLLEAAAASNGDLPSDILEQEFVESSKFPEAGSLVKGFVEHCDKSGVYVRISRGVSAIVPLRFLADRFVENVAKEFPIGSLVAGKVQEVDQTKQSVVISLQASRVVYGGKARYDYSNLQVGTFLSGTVFRVEAYGIFVSIKDSNRLAGLCHVSNISENGSADPTSKFSKGDSVRVCVMSIDTEKRRISLSMKSSDMENDEASEEASEDENASDGDEEDSSSEEENPKKSMTPLSDSDDDSDVETLIKQAALQDDESSDEEESEEETKPSTKTLSLKQALMRTNVSKPKKVSEEASSEESDGDSGDETKVKRKKSSKAKQRERKREEAQLVAKEQALMQDDNAPRSVDDFERLIVASPNSSLLWIQYMAFQLAQTEIDQARAIAERAVRTINFREEAERQNVWFALLNLEHKYGSPDSVNELMKKITPQMNPKHAYYKLAEIMEESGHIDEADAALMKAVKASKGESCGGWFRRIKLQLGNGNSKTARELLQNAIRSIPTRKHAKLILNFARLEYSHANGDCERARTLCEGLIDSYPRRNDIWHQYIDAEIKFGNDVRRVRQLFERVLTIKLSVKKIKAFFKKWLIFETEQGSDEDAENVKARARSYVETIAS